MKLGLRMLINFIQSVVLQRSRVSFLIQYIGLSVYHLAVRVDSFLALNVTNKASLH